MRLDGKVSVVTGAAACLGRASATCFAQEGARLALNDVNGAALQTLVDELGAANTVSRVGDVAVAAEADALTSLAADKWGRVDAGIVMFRDPTELTEDEWDRVMAVNLKSQWLWSRAALRRMIPAHTGAIVMMSSMSAFSGQEFDGVSTFAYNVTKASALQMARSLATRYARDGIRVNALCPGHFKTNIIRGLYPSPEAFEAVYAWISQAVPLGRPGDALELASAALFLVSDDSSYMTGQALVIDGGVLVRQ